MIKIPPLLRMLLAMALSVNDARAQEFVSACEPVFIGWSSTGKAALGVKVDDEGNSRVEYHYKIVDLVTDEIVFVKSFMLGYAAFANGFADESIKSELREFNIALKKYSIIRKKEMAVIRDPDKVVAGSGKYKVIFNKEMHNNIVHGYQLDISNGIKKKKIASRDVQTQKMHSINFLFAAISPDRKRTVIALVGRTPESDFTTFDVQFFGSNLTTGFK
jgi:hypothetical protein